MNEESDEAQSTEEVMRKIEEANKILAEKGLKEISLGSMDVVALYPSLDMETPVSQDSSSDEIKTMSEIQDPLLGGKTFFKYSW